MSERITLRLSKKELEQLDQMQQSEITGTENRCEFIRLLLAREWNRRKGLPKPTTAQFQTAFRNGCQKGTRRTQAVSAEASELAEVHQ